MFFRNFPLTIKQYILSVVIAEILSDCFPCNDLFLCKNMSTHVRMIVRSCFFLNFPGRKTSLEDKYCSLEQ